MKNPDFDTYAVAWSDVVGLLIYTVIVFAIGWTLGAYT